MWTASFYSGNFIGPTVAGFLVDAYGFEWTCVVFVGAYGLIFMIDTCELNYVIRKRTTNNEHERLAGKNSDDCSEKSPLDPNKIEKFG